MEYRYIEAWGKLTNQRYDVTTDLVIKAITTKAPETALFQRVDGVWMTYEDLSESAKNKIEKILDEID
jgi:hypothetical protein